MTFDISYGSPYLRHHGIKGQRWGVQNGPPYPLDKKTYKKAQKLQYSTNKITNNGFRPEDFRRKHTIPKGTTIYRTTANPDEANGGSTYVSYLDVDRNHYKAGWVKKTSGFKQVYENTYMLTEDLVVPSRDELYSVIFDTVKNNEDKIKKTCEIWLDLYMPEDSLERYYVIEDPLTGELDYSKWEKYSADVIDKFGDKSLTEASYFTAQTFGLNKDIRDEVIKELKNRGYNAMTDEASVGGQNGWSKEGIDPLIVFDSSVLYKQSTTPLGEKDEAAARKMYNQWRFDALFKSGAWSAFNIYSNELYHHGIKGQKWGIRRWQRLDGTLTDAGRKRYGDAPEFVKEARLRRQVMRNNVWKGADPRSETSKVDSRFMRDGSYREWYNDGDSKRQHEIAMKFVDDMAGAKLRDMGYTDSKKSREYLAGKDWFQDMLPHMSGYLETERLSRERRAQ